MDPTQWEEVEVPTIDLSWCDTPEDMEGSQRGSVSSRTSYDYFVNLVLDFMDEVNLYEDVNRDTLGLVVRNS